MSKSNRPQKLWALLGLPVFACASGPSDAEPGLEPNIETAELALVAACTEDTVDLPKKAWICPEPKEVQCKRNGQASGGTLYVVPDESGLLTECGAPLTLSDRGPFPLGEHTVEVSVETDAGLTPVCSAQLTVVDTKPPRLTELEMAPLWPPNHKMHRVAAADCFEVRDCDVDVDFRIVSVSSDEPFDAKGDGNTEPDVVFDGCDGVELRAERQGKGDGRVYTLTVEAIDDQGYVSEGQCVVTVPHDQSGDPAVDSGPVETVENTGC